MNTSVSLRVFLSAMFVPLVLAGCFSSSPTRSSGSGDSEGSGSSTGSTSSMPSPSGGGEQSQSGTRGQSTTSGRTAPNSTATAPESGSIPSAESSTGSKSGSSGGKGQLEGKEGGDDGNADIRVASAERPRTGTNNPDAPESDTGRAEGELSGEQVGAAEALEAANAAVDAAAAAVEDAEATIEEAREAVLSDTSGSGDRESYDPFVKSGSQGGEASSPAGSDGSQQAAANADGADSAAPGEGTDASAGGQDAPDNFDPFADYNEAAGGQPGQPSRQQINAASLQIADDALGTANAALNRARRALIAAAGAGGGDADAEAVQLAAARAALEAAAEAVVASAIAVMAAAATADPNAEPITDPEEIQRAMEAFAAGVAQVVSVLHKKMQNAGEALEATAELLTAAGQLISMVGNADVERDRGDGEMTAGERVASLDQELDGSLAVFDDRMTAEGAAADPGMGESTDAIGAAASGAAADPTLANGDMRTTGSGTDGAMRKGDQPVNRRDGRWAESDRDDAWEPNTDSGTKNEQFEIEDAGPGQDDDIVARQLREAAAAETDPELREKLWQEYYAYKESLEQGEADSTR